METEPSGRVAGTTTMVIGTNLQLSYGVPRQRQIPFSIARPFKSGLLNTKLIPSSLELFDHKTSIWSQPHLKGTGVLYPRLRVFLLTLPSIDAKLFTQEKRTGNFCPDWQHQTDPNLILHISSRKSFLCFKQFTCEMCGKYLADPVC